MTELGVNTRRYRITLHKLSDDFSAGEELCEIASMEVTYALTAIPQASVEPAHGIAITGANASVFSQEDMDELIKNRTPMGIALELYDDKDSTHQQCSPEGVKEKYWPIGQTYIFKGYAIGMTFNKTGTHISSKIVLQHWLADIARVNAYSPRCYGANATELAATQFNAIDGRTRSWSFNYDATPWPNNAKTTWEHIRNLMRAMTEDNGTKLKHDTLGAISPELMTRVLNALNKIEMQSEYNPSLISDFATISTNVTNSIAAATQNSWMTSTLWAKIVRDFCPLFFWALVPRVENAYLIAKPSGISNDFTTIKQDEIFSLYYPTLSAPIIGGVAFSISNGNFRNAGGWAREFYPACMYPEPLKEQRGGPIKLLSAPSYLAALGEAHYITLQDYNVPYATTPADQKTNPAQKIPKLIANERIGRAITQYEYIDEVFAGRTAILSLPLRGDLCPGAMIKIEIEADEINKEREIALYGIIESVTLSAAPTQYVTQVTLRNIRTSKEFADPVTNPKQTDLYSVLWSGKGIALYN